MYYQQYLYLLSSCNNSFAGIAGTLTCITTVSAFMNENNN